MKDFLRSIIKEAGALSVEYFRKGVTHETKSNLSDLLTEADVAVSELLVEKIHTKYPDHHIYSEELEEDINPGAEFRWVIDPIDGTRNFAMGLPLFCQIVAIQQNEEIILGAVYNPIAGELFFAEKGKGASMNGMPISVDKKETLDYTAGSFGAYSQESDVYGSHLELFKKVKHRLIDETTMWNHMFGCMIAGCQVASGGFSYFVQNAGLDHDYIAAALICREAGAKVTDSDGNDWMPGRQDIIIANPVLHEQIMKFFKE